MTTVDNLDIQISAQVNKANASLTTLINRLDRVSASLMGVNSRGMATMGSGVNKLTNSMQNFSNATKTDDFSRLARNLSSIGSIDGEKVRAAASGMQSFASALGTLNKIPVSESSLKIAELAKGISQLGYKSSTQAINNIPKLATAMRQLMIELSKAPKVSRNIIDMTNALAKLSRTGASSGRAANALGKSLDSYTASTSRATKGTFSLASAIGKLYATYWLFFRAFGKIGDAIDIASDLTEVQNVVDVTFGKYKQMVEDMAETSIIDFGMSELTVKQISSRFQAMGSAMGFAQGQMANMSIELTKLAADMASFYNVEQADVAEDLESIFTGQTRPLRTYGLDLTEATLKEWAMKQGMDANIDSMSQMEKTMLRYQYVLSNTGAAQGDFARTSESWANQIRILRQQFEQLGVVIGKTFIAALKPLIKALNAAMSHIIAFAQTVSNALGKIFGWKFEVDGGGITTDLEDGADYSDQLASGLGDAANNAKKLKQQLQGFDALNVLSSSDQKESSGSGSAGIGSGASATNGQWIESDSMFKEFESEIDTLYELGEYIRDSFIGMMESIDWESVYEKARGFGKGLAEFLNGLLAYDGEGRTLFGTVAKTLANTLNSIVYAALEFAKEFDFYQFGVNLADAINQFFINFDFKAFAQALNEWVDGFKEMVLGFLEKISWSDVFSGIYDFFSEIELDTLAFIVGAIAWKHGGKALTKEVFKRLLIDKLGLTSITVSAFVTVGASIVFVGGLIKDAMEERFDTSDWNFGEWIYNTLKASVEGYQSNINGILLNMFYSMQESGEGTIGEVLYNIFGKYFEETDFTKTFEPALTAIKAFATEFFNLITFPFRYAIEQTKENIQNIILIAYGLNEKVKEILENLKSIFTEKLSQLWTNNIYPWFTTEKWESLFEVIRTSIKNIFTKIVSQWSSDISNWWKNNVEPWFNIAKWIFMLSPVSTAFLNVFQQIKNTVTQKIQSIYNYFAGIVSSIVSKMNSLQNALNIGSVLGSTNISLNIASQIRGFASGGYVPSSYSMFMAGENGVPELMGTVGGRTAVAGGAEITGIRDEIRSTANEEIMLLRQQNALLQAILEKDGISDGALFQSVRSSANNYFKMTGEKAFA